MTTDTLSRTFRPAVAKAIRDGQAKNMAHGARLAQRDENDGITVGHFTDDGLRRLVRTYRRELEDVEAGDRNLSAGALRVLKVRLRDVEREQDVRTTLRLSWLAEPNGTDSYSDFMAYGGFPAVVRGEGLAPSYALAMQLDEGMFRLRRIHCFEWKCEQLPADHPLVTGPAWFLAPEMVA